MKKNECLLVGIASRGQKIHVRSWSCGKQLCLARGGKATLVVIEHTMSEMVTPGSITLILDLYTALMDPLRKSRRRMSSPELLATYLA